MSGWFTRVPRSAAVLSSLALACSGASPTLTGNNLERSAPEPTGSDVILWQDDFDGAAPLSRYATRGSIQPINGRSGQALRFAYSSSSDDNLLESLPGRGSDLQRAR